MICLYGNITRLQNFGAVYVVFSLCCARSLAQSAAAAGDERKELVRLFNSNSDIAILISGPMVDPCGVYSLLYLL